MKPQITTFLALLLCFSSYAQSNNLTATKIRAEESLRVGSTTSQKITGFDLAIPGSPTHSRLATTRAVWEYIQGTCILGNSTAGGDVSGPFSNLIVNRLLGRPMSTTPPQMGQTLKWTGSQWVPADDLNDGKTYAAGAGIFIDGLYQIINTGDLDPANEIQVLNLVGNTLGLSNGGGSVSLPAPGPTYSSGPGILIDGVQIINTGDLDSLNEIQTLHLSGDTLKLSRGGSVVLPAGGGSSDGNGIYDGNGTIPANTTATAVDHFDLATPTGHIGSFPPVFGLSANAFTGAYYVDPNTLLGYSIDPTAKSIGFVARDLSTLGFSTLSFSPTFASIYSSGDVQLNADGVFELNTATAVFSGQDMTFYSGSGEGIKYGGDNSAGIIADDRAIPDVGTIKEHLNGPYSGSGEIPMGTDAKIQSGGGNFRILYSDDQGATPALTIDDVNGGILMSDPANAAQFGTDGGTVFMGSSGGNFSISGGGPVVRSFADGGMKYFDDYSATIATEDRAIPDVGTIKAHFNGLYGGSGIILNDTHAKLEGEFTTFWIDYNNDTPAIYIDPDGAAGVGIKSPNGLNYFFIDDGGVAFSAPGASLGLRSEAYDFLSTTAPLYPPRLTTTQRDAIVNLREGALIFNKDTKKWQGFDGTSWYDF